MNAAYIKFNSLNHQVKGHYEPANHATVTSLPDGVFIVRVQA